MQIEVIVATREPAEVYWLECDSAEIVATALARLSTRLHEEEIDADRTIIAIHGQQVTKDAKLAEGDRIEILSPLVVDPKEARRQRAHSDRNQRLKNPHSTISSSSS